MAVNAMLVQVIYASATHYWEKTLSVPEKTSIQIVIETSGVLDVFRDINLKVNKVGIYVELVSLQQEALDNDRIEIYRPLLHDPKELRKKRAIGQKKRTQESF